jgi:hypothetical protein
MLHLASQSPRRRQLLEQLGVAFAVIDVEVPEQREPGESPQDYVSRVARDKARAGLAALPDASSAWVLGADTEVVLDDEVFGKPRRQELVRARRLGGLAVELPVAIEQRHQRIEIGTGCRTDGEGHARALLGNIKPDDRGGRS